MTDTSEPGRRPVRIGDTEREAAVRELGEHFAAGRLTEEEHAERTEQAYAARTQQDLDGLFVDLPGGGAAEGQSRGQEQQRPWGSPWAQGGPPWAAAWAGQRGGSGGPGLGRAWRWLPVPFLVLAGLGAACAISKGFFPFFVIPLLAIAGTFFVLGKKGYFGGQGPRQKHGNRA